MTFRRATSTDVVISQVVPPAIVQIRELWRFRELLFFLTWKEVKVRYVQTVIGAAWAILQPIAMMLVFALIFGRIAHVPTNGVPYPVFYFTALVPWTYFSAVVGNSTNSLVQSQSLVQKVYFPRLTLPLSSALASLVDLSINAVIMIVLSFAYGMRPRPELALIPAFLVLLFIAATGSGVWAGALNAMYRDIRLAVPVALQIWLFVSPVVYPSRLIPRRWQWIYHANPMAVTIEGMRWCVTGVDPPRPAFTALSAAIACLVLGTGLKYFWRSESTFADVV